MQHKTIDALTGFRFAAALLVFMHHYPVPGASGAALRAMNAGYNGVTFFFVLSGFVLCYNYLDAFRDAPIRALAPYVVARFARIYPVYLLVLLFVWLGSGATADVLPYLLMVQAWSSDARTAFGLMGPGWSLAVEVILYMAFPLIVVVFERAGIFANGTRLAIASVAISLAMFGAASYLEVTGGRATGTVDPVAHRWLYWTPLPRLGDFMLGVLGAGFFLAYRERLRGRQHLWSYVVGGACVVVLLLMVWEPNLYSAFSWDVAYAVPAAVLIVGLALSEKSIVARVLRSRAFVTLGELSYCFYLLHVPLGALKGGATASQPWTQVAYYFVFLFMVVALSHGVHRLVERPAQRWIKQAYAALAQRRSRAIAPADRIVR